jgi:hypothetical protein
MTLIKDSTEALYWNMVKSLDSPFQAMLLLKENYHVDSTHAAQDATKRLNNLKLESHEDWTTYLGRYEAIIEELHDCGIEKDKKSTRSTFIDGICGDGLNDPVDLKMLKAKLNVSMTWNGCALCRMLQELSEISEKLKRMRRRPLHQFSVLERRSYNDQPLAKKPKWTLCSFCNIKGHEASACLVNPASRRYAPEFKNWLDKKPRRGSTDSEIQEWKRVKPINAPPPKPAEQYAEPYRSN